MNLRGLHALVLLAASAGGCVSRWGIASLPPGPGDGEAVTPCQPETDQELCLNATDGLCGTHAFTDRCGGGRAVWCDPCRFPDACGGGGVATECGHAGWQGIGASELTPWSTELTWGTASGGGLSANSGSSDSPKLRRDGQGRLLVLWLDNTPLTTALVLRRWDGTSWEELGGWGAVPAINDPSVSPMFAVMAVDASDHPLVAWTANVLSDSRIFFKRWTGTVWEEVSGSASGTGLGAAGYSATAPALAAAADGTVWIAYVQGITASPYQAVYVKSLVGTTWAEAATGSASGNGVSGNTGSVGTPQLLVDGAGRLIVAWADAESGKYQILVKRLEVGAFVELGTGAGSGGGVSASANGAGDPRLALATDGSPLLAWGSSVWPPSLQIARFDGSAWVEVGSGSNVEPGLGALDGSTSGLTLGARADGSIVLTWSGGWPELLHALTWDGVSWRSGDPETLGGESVDTLDPSNPTAVVDDSGVWWAWRENTATNGEIYLAHCIDTACLELGSGSATGSPTISLGSEAPGSPRLRFGADAQPILAWTEGSQEVRVRTFLAGSWQDLGTGSGEGGGVALALWPSLYTWAGFDVDASGAPVVLWTDFSMHLRQWQVDRWRTLPGPVLSDTGVSQLAHVAVRGNALTVVWAGETAAGIFLAVWDGTSWQELGGSMTGAGLAVGGTSETTPAVALDALGRPTVAWVYRDATYNYVVYLKRWDGSAWTSLAGSASGSGVSQDTNPASLPLVAVDDGGVATVAWTAMPPGSVARVFVRQWNGTSFVELAGSASGLGLSNSTMPAIEASLALDADGQPLVAWRDASRGQGEIYLERWQGGAWQGLEGSATGGGVSNSTSSSSSPNLTVTGSRACVTWVERARTADVVLARCHDL